MRRRSPQPLAYGGGGGPGSASNLIMALFLNRADLKMTSVSYRGTAPALTDVIGGHIPVTFVPISEAVAQADQSEHPHARGVERQALGSACRTCRRSRKPIRATTRCPGPACWRPPERRRPIIDKLAAEMANARARTRSSSSSSQSNGIDPAIEGPEKFAAFIAAEIPNWAKAVEIAGVKVQQ